MRTIYQKMAYKVQNTRMNFTQAALNMQMGFTILDAMSRPSSLLAITSALCYYHFPWTVSTEIFPLCVFPLHFPHYQNCKEGI